MVKKKVNQTRSLAMKKSWAERRNSTMREQARKRAAKPKENGEAKFWILWAPSSHKPPRVRFTTLDHVNKIADHMVNKYRMEVYVMQSVNLHRLSSPEVVPYNGKPKAVEEPKEVKKNTFQVTSLPQPLQNHGQAWDAQEKEQMVCMYAGTAGYTKHTISQIAAALGRSEYAIECQLHNMGIRDKDTGNDPWPRSNRLLIPRGDDYL